MRLAVIGCGYVGLVTGSCLAEAGHEVVATDNDVARINMLNSGRLPIYEPGLDHVMQSASAAGRLQFHVRLRRGGSRSGCYFHLRGNAAARFRRSRSFRNRQRGPADRGGSALAETGDREEHRAGAHR